MKKFYQARMTIVGSGSFKVEQSSDVIFYDKESAESFLKNWETRIKQADLSVAEKEIKELVVF